MKKSRLPTEKKEIFSKQSLYSVFPLIKTCEDAKKFFEDLCTPTEIQAMADRWEVVKLLKENKPYRTIYNQTGVSVTTIGRVARCLYLGEGGYRLLYKRYKTLKKS